jgi:casein kinase II subunit alpha
VKQIKKDEEARVAREIKILNVLQGGPGIVKYFGCYHEIDTNKIGLVFERLKYQEWRKDYVNFNDSDKKELIRGMLESLDYAHSMGVIHRDVKPRNTIYWPTNESDESTPGKVVMLDWGTATYYTGNAMTLNVGTQHYNAPEIILGFKYYDYGIDVWSVAVIMGALVYPCSLILGK